MTITVHHVTFYSPGTFVSETTSRPIASWDAAAACEMATSIFERYNARPYAFAFSTSITAPPVPDGQGGTLNVQPRETARSGLHFLDGSVLTIEDVAARSDPKDDILLSNMRGGMPIVVESINGWRSVHPFGAGDVVVNASGRVTERGDSPERIAYRAKCGA